MVLDKEEMVALQLPATVGSARVARLAVEGMPELERYDDLQFIAALLTTELVTNAVRHAGLMPEEQLTVLLDGENGFVHVEVIDSGGGVYALQHTRSVPGRRVEHGVHLVDVLADRWGFRRDRPGYCAWFELDLVSGRRSWRGREPVRQRYV